MTAQTAQPGLFERPRDTGLGPTICSACGANLGAYWVTLTPGIIRALIKFRQALAAKQINKIHLLDDMVDREYELTPHEWNNFSRLRFHALVAKFKENGEHEAGYWLLTSRGAAFLRGEADIPVKVKVFRNHVVDHSEERVFIKDVIGSTPYFETIDDIQYE